MRLRGQGGRPVRKAADAGVVTTSTHGDVFQTTISSADSPKVHNASTGQIFCMP